MKKTTAVLMAVFLMLCSLPAGADAVLPAGPAPDEERVETPDGITFITAYSSVTEQVYDMTCTDQGDNTVICSGGNNAQILLWGAPAR